MKYLIIIIIFIFTGQEIFPQDDSLKQKEVMVNHLLDSLWANPTSFFNKMDPNWRMLCSNIHHINMPRLNQITDSIYFGTDARIENESLSSKGILDSMNKNSHDKKVKQFEKKIKHDFDNKARYPNHKVILVEGDSWFEYQLFLHEITDDLMKKDNLAVYSLA